MGATAWAAFKLLPPKPAIREWPSVSPMKAAIALGLLIAAMPEPTAANLATLFRAKIVVADFAAKSILP